MDDYDRRRLRPSLWIAAGGLLLGVVGAVAIGAMGASGAAGVAVVLVCAAGGCVLAALHVAIRCMADEYRHRPVGRPRTLAALWFFLGAGLLLIMSTGAVAAAGGSAAGGAAAEGAAAEEAAAGGAAADHREQLVDDIHRPTS